MESVGTVLVEVTVLFDHNRMSAVGAVLAVQKKEQEPCLVVAQNQELILPELVHLPAHQSQLMP